MTDTLTTRATDAAVRVLRVGLLGLGVVGQGLVRLLGTRREEIARRHGVEFRIDRVLVRDVGRPREERPPRAEITADPAAFLAGDYDLVVEAIGGVEPAGSFVQAALERGVPVVSGNKTLLATRADELHGPLQPVTRRTARLTRTTAVQPTPDADRDAIVDAMLASIENAADGDWSVDTQQDPPEPKKRSKAKKTRQRPAKKSAAEIRGSSS